MAGHSKWANIQHRKKAQDSKRGKLFTRLVREVTVAVRESGPDPEANPRLRLALEKCNKNSVPKDNLERAIKKASGEGADANAFEEIRYEGYGPGGVAIMVDTVTDNRNRTVSEVRHAFSKHGGNLGTDGSVAYLFEKRGVLTFAPGSDEDKLMEVGLEGGADDVLVDEDDGSVEMLTSPEAYSDVLAAVQGADVEAAESDLTMRPMTRVDLDVDTAAKVLKLLDVLEDLDDTQNVYNNANIPDEAYQD
jgi:YebC/PmpR family DNA-binding regulatory protein